MVCPKFELLTCGLKSHFASVSLDSFLFYLILYFYVFFFFFFFVFLDERDIKMEQNYIFRHIFNKTELHNSN